MPTSAASWRKVPGNQGVLDVEIAPSELYVEMTLRSAHCNFVRAVSEYIALARPDKQAIADQIEKDLVAVWKT